MASSNWTRITSLLLLMISYCGVFGRAVGTLELLSQLPKTADESYEATLRAGRWRRGMADTHRERCAELEAPWLENTREAHVDSGIPLQLRIRSFSPRASRGLVFPGKALFKFIRGVYRCCQEGVNCRRLKGIQGRMRGGTEFVLTGEILSLTVARAELHLQLSNPRHLDIRPVLPTMAKHKLPTRYSLGSRGDTVDLRVDLLFLFHSVQEVVGGAGRGPSLTNMRRAVLFSNGDPPGENPTGMAPQDTDANVLGSGLTSTLSPLDLGLVLGCSQAGTEVSCGAGGVHITHTPFMALFFG
uniref:Uncharacterized protein n=1 Tax=Amphilophus citrinellus TaxID=61819 RepID=A0A3Q0SRU0_AMPCI